MRLGRERSVEQRRDEVEVDLQQGRDHTDVGNVLHQDAGARGVELLIAHLRQRHADDRDILAIEKPAARPRGIVDQPPAGTNRHHIFDVGLHVHRDDDVDPFGPGLVAVARHADLVPGRQSLDIGREIILADDRDPHPENCLHHEAIRARGSGAIDRGDLDDDVVDSWHGANFLDVRSLLAGRSPAPRLAGRELVAGLRDEDLRTLHVPGPRRATLGSQTAMHAQVLVLDHDAVGLRQSG